MVRLPFIDWARGFAVLAMVLWHTGDGWLRLDQRQGQAWLALRFIGGLAAPSFIFLAGCGAALASKVPANSHQASSVFRASASRGLEVLVIGYALRLQTWLLDAGALIRPGQLRAWLPIVVGYTLLWVGLRKLPSEPHRATRLLLAALISCLVGFTQVESVAPGRFARLLQVDVLQEIGASLFLLALGQRLCRLLERPGLLLLGSLAVACATSVVTRALPGPLPHGVAGYLGKFDVPQGTPVPALFPLFPWLAYALAGAAWGTLLKRARGREDRTVVLFAIFGAVIALLTSEAHPFIHRVISAQPWLVSPIRVGFRLGIVSTVLLLGLLWVNQARGKLLLIFGRHSMRIYWAHMLFAYGVLGRVLQKKLEFGAWALWLLPLFGAMWCLTRVSRPAIKAPTQAVRT